MTYTNKELRYLTAWSAAKEALGNPQVFDWTKDSAEKKIVAEQAEDTIIAFAIATCLELAVAVSHESPSLSPTLKKNLTFLGSLIQKYPDLFERRNSDLVKIHPKLKELLGIRELLVRYNATLVKFEITEKE